MRWFWEQLSLLLRTKLILRSRQPVILALEVLWPITIFLIVLGIRKTIPPVPQDVCHYNARVLPSGGAVPMLQSIICNIDNACLNETQYEEFPSYPQARVQQIVDELAPVMNDKEALEVIKALPKGIRLLEAAAEVINNPIIRNVLDNGIHVMQFLKDPDKVAEWLQKVLNLTSPEVPKALTNATIRITKLLEVLTDMQNLKRILCSPSEVGELLSISDPLLQNKTSQVFCSVEDINFEFIDLEKIVDIDKLLKMVADLFTPLGRPDIAIILEDTARTFQVANQLDKSFPVADELKHHLQAIEEALQSKHINLKLLVRITKDIEPLFGEGPLADIIRNILNLGEDLVRNTGLNANIRNPMDTSESSVSELIQDVKPFTFGSVLPKQFVFNTALRNSFRQVSHKEILDIHIKKETYKLFRDGLSPETFQYVVCKKYELSDLLHLPANNKRLYQDLQDFKDVLCSIDPEEHKKVKITTKPFEVKPVLELLANRSELLSFFDKENNGLAKAIPVIKVIIEAMLNSMKEEKMDDGKLLPDFVRIILSTLGKIFPLSYSNFGYAVFDGLDIILDLLGQGISALNRENSVEHWPKFARTMVATLSNNETVLPKKCSAFSKMFCDRSRFHTLVTIPDSDSSPDIIREIGCHLFKSIETKKSASRSTVLSKPPITAFSSVKNATLNWGGAAKKTYSLLDKLQQMKAKVPNEISDEILEEVLDMWNDTSITNKMLAVLRTLDVMTDCIRKQNPPYWNDFLAIFSVTGKVIEVLNARMGSIIDSNSAEVSNLSPESPVLSVAVEKIVSLIPDLINTISNVLTKELKSVLKKFKDTDRLSKIPCHGVSISEILHFDKAKDVQELERYLCENTQQLLHEILMIPNIDSAARDIDRANKGKMVRMNWVSQINSLEVFRDRTDKLSRFNGSKFSDIPGFDREFQESLTRIRHVVDNISSSERGIAKFVGYLLDSALMVSAEVNVTEDQRQLPFSLQCDFEVSQDENGKPDYASCIISGLRYALWAATEVLEKINRYLSWITGTVGDPGRGEMPLIADIGLMLEEGISLVNSLIETALRHENMNLTLSQFCSGPAFLEVIVFPNEKAKLHVTHLQESLCSFMSTKENTVPFDGPFLQHLSVVKLLKNLNNTWYNSTPAEISSDIPTFLDEAFDFYNNIVSIDKNPEGSLDKWNKAVLNSSVWNEVNLKMNDILEKLMQKSFMYSLQALTPTLMEVIKNNSVLGERLGTSALILEVVDSYLKNDTYMEEIAIDSEGLFEAVRPLMTWIQKHGIGFSGHILYTLITDGNKFFRLLYEEEPLNKLCSSPVSQFIHHLPGGNESSFEEAKEDLCKIDWKSMIAFAKMKIERLNLTTSYEIAKRFTSSLGAMLDTLYSKTTNPDSDNIEFLQAWNTTLHILKASINERNFTWDQPQNWLTPAIAAAASIIDKNDLTLLAMAEVVNSINCRLSMLKGGFSWDKVETAFANKPYVLSFLKILNSSIDVVNMTLDLLIQPDKFEAIRDAFLESNSSNNFCNNGEWENYIDLSDSNRLEIIRSIQYLICKGNGTTLLNQLNPERLCVRKKSRELYAMGSFSPVVFATHIEELYQAMNDLITDAYQRHANSSNTFREMLNSQKWQKLFEEFWYKVHEQSTPNGLIKTLFSVFRVVDRMFRNESNTSPSKKALEFIEKGIISLDIAAQPDGNASYESSLNLIQESFTSAITLNKKPTKGSLDTYFYHLKFNAMVDHFKNHGDQRAILCACDPKTWKKKLTSYLFRIHEVICDTPPKEWEIQLEKRFEQRTPLEKYRAVTDVFKLMISECEQKAIMNTIREKELDLLSDVAYAVVSKISNETNDTATPHVHWPDWRVLINSTWNIIPNFLEMMDKQSCHIFARYDAHMLMVSELFGRIFQRFPDAYFLACQLTNRTIPELYDWFSTTFEIRTICQMIADKWDDIANQEKKECVTPYGTAARGGKLIQRFANELALNENRKQVQDCITNSAMTEFFHSLKEYLTLFNVSLGLLNDTKTLKGGMESIVDFIIKQIPVKSQISQFIADIASFEDSLREPQYFLQESDIQSIKELVADITWIARKNFSQEVIYKEICDDSPEKRFSIFMIHEDKETLSKILCGENNVLKILLESLDKDMIIEQLPELQENEFLKGEWLERLSEGFQELMHSIMDLVSVGFDLMKRFREDGPESLFSLVKLEAISDLLKSASTVLNVAESAFGQSLIVEDIRDIVRGLKGLEILNHLKVFDITYKLKDFFEDASSMISLLMERYRLTKEAADSLLESSIDLEPILKKRDGDLTVQKTFCDPEKLDELLAGDLPFTTDNVSSMLCNISSSQVVSIPSSSSSLLDLAFQKIGKTLGEVAIQGLLEKADLNMDDIPNIFENVKKAPKILQDMQGLVDNVINMLGDETDKELKKMNLSAEGAQLLGSTTAQKMIGKIMCGKPLVFFETQIRYVQVKVQKPKLDRKEVRKLPSSFCVRAYKQIMQMDGGPILWGYLKPFMKGKILYSPNNVATRSVIKELNKTVEMMMDFINTLHIWGEGIGGLESLQKHEGSISVLQEYVTSEEYRPLIKRFIEGDIDEITQHMNITSIVEQVKKVSGLLNMLQLVGHITQCVEINRFIGLKTETELEDKAIRLHQDREFIGAVVFENLNDKQRQQRPKRNSPFLPTHVSYKIRLDIDNVPTTKRIKNKFWEPDPHNVFFEDLRYLRGFVYLQELLDRAITYLQLGHDLPLSPTVYLQQFPYPCYQKDSFGQFFRMVIPVIVVIAWIFFIAFTIQDHVLQRELHLEEMLTVMGLRPVVAWLAWFILSYTILAINIAAFIPILKLGDIFPQTGTSVLSVFLFIYGLSNVMFCYLVSSLFRSAAIASLIGIFAFLASFLPFVIIITLEWHLTLFEKIITCFPMSSAFAYGYLYIVRYETQGVGLQWDNIWKSPIAGDTMCFGYVLIILAVDTVAYFLAGWYIVNVWPAGHKAMKQPWYFFMLPSYWGLKKPKRTYLYSEKTTNMRRHSSLAAESGKAVGVSFLNLHVVYNRNASYERKAVAGLTLDLLEGEITTLLGKNGAGKTTTINVLIGQFPPTSGAVYVYGKAVPTEYEEARKLLGYCPQYNTLFKFLTVREHLIFYAKLKGLIKDKSELIEDVENILHSMGLWKLRNEKVGFLSGGLQRRVCVALAFVGGSRLIILDEPTSSVDPVARRSIWDLILKQKSGRTVLLTTHHMDEADILSDKVAILHKGKVLCQGSPLLLKNKHSFGYKLTVARHGPDTESDNDSGRMSTASSENEPCDGHGLLEFVKKMIPGANLIEDYGSEVIIGIPSQDSSGKQQTFSDFFRALDANLQDLGYGSYGLSSTTLEEVFLTLCNPEDDVTPQGSPALKHLTQRSHSKDLSTAEVIPNDSCIAFDVNGHAISDSKQKIYWVPSELDLSGSKTLTGVKLKMQQLSALLTKRFHHTIHNWRTLLCSIAMPCLFIALAMGFALIREPQVPDPTIQLKPQLYGPHSTSFFKLEEPYNESTMTPIFENLIGTSCSDNITDTSNYGSSMQCNVGPAKAVELSNYSGFSCKTLCRCQGPERKCMSSDHSSVSPPALLTDFGVTYNLSEINVPDYLLDTYCSFVENRYGGWTFHNSSSGDAIKVWYENSGYHAMTGYLSALNNAILKANLRAVGTDPTEYGITTYNHPLNLRVEQLGKESLVQRIADVGIAFTFLMGFAFIPASFVFYIVRERMNEEKRLQQVVGVGALLYWLSTLLWDLLLLIVAVGLSAGVIAIFQLPVYVAKLNMPAVLTVSFLFGWSMMTVVYLMEMLFKESTIAFLVIYCVSLFIGINFMVISIIFSIFPPNQRVLTAVEGVKKLALGFPPYNMINSLIEVTKNYFLAEIYEIFGQDVYVNPFSMNLLGAFLIIMAVQGLVLFVIKVIIEQPINWTRWFYHTFDTKDIERAKPYMQNEDIDVADERKRVLNITSQNDVVLKLVNVTKIFRGMMGKRTAVDNVSLAIPKGECFGLLGVNGAGKTTLFRILTGQIRPTLGKAYLNSQTISKMLAKSGQSLGYCPQADALDDLLTPVQHLTIYAKLRGIPSKEVPKVVEAAIIKFSLEMYAKQPVGTLSRGNKRKLCTAIAMLGDPEIILLDEPTSGMDPVTRRVVWHNVMQAIKANRSVVLTSHSMEECDILCSRLAIMVNGRFCCLGSPQYLKHRFGRGYTVSLQIDNADKRLQTISKFMSANFPSAHLRAHHYNMLEFNVPSKNIPLSIIFDLLENERDTLGILDFSVSQTTLDQVFVTFAQQQTDDADFTNDLDDSKDRISTAQYENPSYSTILFDEAPTPSPSPLPIYDPRTESEQMVEPMSTETRAGSEATSVSAQVSSHSDTDHTKVDISNDEQGHNVMTRF